MKISKRQLRRIIKEEKARLHEQEMVNPDFDVETSLSELNTALFAAVPVIEELMEAIQNGDWADDPGEAMKTLVNQVDEFTYDAFGEYLIDKRKLQRLSRPAK
jgi:hypothetical protein